MKKETKENLESYGFQNKVKKVRNKKCPFCNKPIDMKSFTDSISVREYQISGLCQACQDDIFGEEDEE